MDLLAAACVIIITIASTLLPSVSTSRVLGTKVALDTIDTLSPKAEVIQMAQDAREEAKEERRAAIEDAREEFREKLAEIKDAQKQRILEHIGDRLGQVNDRWTTHFDNVLSRLGEILAKIGTRADKLEEDGVDVTSVREAITNAEAAIDATQEVVDAQAENSYVIDITDEESLKDNVKEVRDELHTDLTAARDEVKTAKEAVHDALQALKDVFSDNDSEEGETDEE